MTSAAASGVTVASTAMNGGGSDRPTFAAPMVCAGCGYRAPDDDPFPIACPRRVDGDDTDHVMTRRLEAALVRWPAGGSDEPFVRYRELLRAWHRARELGWPDDRFVAMVEHLDAQVARVAGHGFRPTPLARRDGLDEALGSRAPGGVWVKDETGNVAGSHKARHLFGVLLELAVGEGAGSGAAPLAIASCGNAALAAAVVARAAGRRLEVLVPEWADRLVLGELGRLGAEVRVCLRRGGVPGDPTVSELRAAVAAGAVPFTCQGDQNGLAIQGGQTLGYEMVDQLRAMGAHLDVLVVQVGGGALAAATIAAFEEARALGVVERLPRLVCVQTEGCWPLRRAWDHVGARLREELGWQGEPLDPDGSPARELLADVARHRSRCMWPWEAEPRSVAHGILDDETYDWLAVVRGLLASGGQVVVVDEATLEEANDLAARTTGISVDPTGSAGLAGLVSLRRSGGISPTDRVGVLFTGRRRDLRAGPAPGAPPLERSTP